VNHIGGFQAVSNLGFQGWAAAVLTTESYLVSAS
jgi:hypothetical protein